MASSEPDDWLREHLLRGQVIPAHPLALDRSRRFDERYQRALTRYYVEAGAGGVAVGVHTTQFAIREHGLYEPVLALAAETARSSLAGARRRFVLVAGVMGNTRQAVAEAARARDLGYDIALLGLGALRDAPDEALIEHCRSVGEVLPLFGFYLQTAVGGRVLGARFWRALSELPALRAIKIAPFDRYRTLDVVRGVVQAGRRDVALYTGNDDTIIADLLTPFPGRGGDGSHSDAAETRIVGGLLGQWAVWTRRAVEMLAEIRELPAEGASVAAWLRRAARLTDANSAIFDAAHGFAGCIPGIHEVLRRQGLLATSLCLDPNELLSPGQPAEIDRVLRDYPELSDDSFVAAGLDRWLA